MKLGDVLKKERERKGLSVAVMAERLNLSLAEYEKVEAGISPLEQYGTLVLNFAQVIEQPVSSLYYPCGIPFQELEDYKITVRP